jgi:hypothetical protein
MERISLKTYLLGAPFTGANVLARLQVGQNIFSSGLFFLELLHLQRLATTTSLLLKGIESLLNKLDILDAQLLADDVQITARVDITLNVNDLSIIEAANHLEDGIDSTDVGQERVTQTSTSRGTAGQTGNIIHGQVSGNLRLGLVMLAEPVEPLIGNDNAGLLGVNGGIGEIGRVTQGGLGDGLEECRLADIGKTNLKPLLEWVVGKERRKKSQEERGQGGLNSFSVELKSGLCCVEKRKKRVGALLTYDTTLQVVSWTAQVNLFLNLLLLGRHFIRFFLLA